MSVLDTYYFLFEADTSKVKKGSEEGGKAADELGKKLKATDETAKKTGESFLEIAKAAGKAFAAIAALGIIKTITTDTADNTFAVAQQARAIGVSVEALSTWQHAVVAAGGTAEGAAQSMETLRGKFVEMSRFGVMMGPDSFMFKQLGLSAQDMKDSIKDPTVALGKLAETFGKLNNTQQLFIGKKLGLDMGTINILSQGRRVFDEIIAKQKELGVVTEAQAAAATKFKLAQMQLGLVLETTKREITTAILPAMTWMIEKTEKLVNWLREHKTFSIAFFGGIAAVITTLLLPALWAAAVATWAFLSPVLIVGAAVLALGAIFALVADDVDKFLHGQNSIIGELSKKWPVVGEVVKAAAGAVSYFVDIALAALKLFSDYFEIGPTKALDNFNKKIDEVFKNMGERFPKMAKLVKLLTDPVTSATDLFDKLQQIGDIVQGKTTEEAHADGAVANTRTVKSNAKGAEIAEKLEKKGWTPEQAAGIAGSFLQESNGDATAKNKTSGAYGLGQWLGSRVKDFKEFSGKDLEGSSLDDQLDFFQYEVTKGKERRAGDKLRAATTAAEAAAAHSKYYERPGEAEANVARRQGMANDILAGKKTIEAANAPIASQTSQSIANSKVSNRTSSVNIGSVGITTQATDAKGVQDAFTTSLYGQLKNTLDDFDDGVAA